MARTSFPISAAFMAVLLLPGTGFAATMTFSDLPNGAALATDYTESGIEAEVGWGVLGSHTTPGTAHLNDGGTLFTSEITFSLASGTKFDAVGFDLLPLPAQGPVDSFDNIELTGFRGSSMVASESFFLGTEDRRHAFSPAFTSLTELTIGITWPPGGCSVAPPCLQLDIDNVELVPAVWPVPVPPTLWTLLGGVLALAALGLRPRSLLRARTSPA